MRSATPCCGGIPPRHVERIGRHIDRRDPRVLLLVREADRDAPGTGAEVEDGRRR